jgi:hypothetical protein
MERKKSFIEIHEPEKYDSEKLARLSPHELFEGENSSLKKTFDEAVRDPMAEAILKDHSKVIQDSAEQSCKDQNDMMEKHNEVLINRVSFEFKASPLDTMSSLIDQDSMHGEFVNHINGKTTEEMMEKQFGSDYGFWRDGKYIDLSEEEALEIVRQVEDSKKSIDDLNEKSLRENIKWEIANAKEDKEITFYLYNIEFTGKITGANK